MARRPLIAGNWKMNLNHLEAIAHVQKLAYTLTDREAKAAEVVVIPPFTDLRSVQTLVDGDKLPIGFGAQDVSQHASGAYTGEVSGAMLAKLACQYVIVGHSERRQYHGETDAIVAAKARAAYANGITPILCVGEALDIRERGEHVGYTLASLSGSLDGIDAAQAASLVVAYEPVWAIGTGKTATPADAQEMSAAIRGALADRYSAEVADAVRILYGGSMKADNARELLAQPDVDGGLVGGASLVPVDFAAIAKAVLPA